MAELRSSQVAEDEKVRKAAIGKKGRHDGTDSDTEAETIVDTGVSGSKEVEVLDVKGDLKDRAKGSPWGSKSEISTEDEWEKVSEEENEKDK